MWGRFLITIGILSVVFNGYSQQKQWIDLLNQPNVNYFEMVKAYQQQYANQEIKPHNGHKQFERWLWNNSGRVLPDGSLQSNVEIENAAKIYYRQHASRSLTGNWVEIGPWQEENYSRGVGRLTCMAFDPSDPYKFYVGTPAGGLFYTEDDGKTWVKPDDNIANFGVSSIAVDPKNANVVYAGTGDADARETDGRGVWKSTDGGKTWVEKNLGMGNITVGKLIIDPHNSQVIYAATQTGIWKSKDGGGAWVLKYPNKDMRDMEMKPNDSKVLYASNYVSGLGALIFISKDEGETWEQKFVFDGLYPDLRYELAVCKKNPDLLIGVGGLRIVKTLDMGDTFTVVTTEGNQLYDRDNRQGWYNAAFEIDPTNENKWFVGNVQLYKTTDAGETFLSTRHTHADNHFLAFSPHNNDLYVCDDGGIHRSKDGGHTFEDLTNFGNSAIYSVSQSPFNSEHTLTGYQDCGSKYYDGYKWTSTYGADGMQPLFDATDSNIFYTAYQYGRVVRYLKHIGSAQVLPAPEKPSDVTATTYRGPWVTPYVLDPNDNKTIYVGWDRVWKCSNLHTNKTKDIVWTEASSAIGKQIGGQYIRLKFSRTHPKRLMALVQNSSRSRVDLIKTDDITATNPVWDRVSNTAPVGSSNGDFETDTKDSLAIYLVSNNVVYETKDGGVNWTNVNGSLPKVPIHCIEIDTTNSDLYIGTHAGVFYKGANDTDWTPFVNGMSKNARVRDLDIYYAADHKNSKLKAATYGRGLWESELYGSHSAVSDITFAYINSQHGAFTFEDEITIDVTFKRHVTNKMVSGFDQSDIIVQNGQITSFNGQNDIYTIKIQADSIGKIRVTIPQGAAVDVSTGLNTGASTEWSINYVEMPKSVGPFGPGGVGDSLNLGFWFRADHAMVNASGDTITSDMEKVEEWYDFYGSKFSAVQTTDSSKPFFRTDTNGINGWPAVEYRPPNRFFMVRDFFPVGNNISVFAVTQSNTPKWTGHSWIANSREKNGFLLHNNNDGNTTYGVIVDENNSNIGTPSIEVTDVTKPHIMSMQFNGSQWKNMFFADNQVSEDYITRDYVRVGSDTIDVRLGKDMRERYGDGKLGEIIYFREDIGEAKRLIVSNYLSSKYGVNLEDADLYDYDSDFAFEVAGIGKQSALDFHTKAKGTGLLMVEGDMNQMTEGSYLMWGHNNQSLAWKKRDDLQPGLQLNERVWRMDNHGGSVGSVTVSLKAAELNNLSQKLALVVSKNADFTGAMTYEFVLSNGSYQAVVPSFSKGDYVTLGQAEKFYIGAQEQGKQYIVKLWPNPSANGKSTLTLWSNGGQDVEISITDNSGRIVQSLNYSTREGNNSIGLDISQYSSGIYLVNVKDENGSTVLKLIR